VRWPIVLAVPSALVITLIAGAESIDTPERGVHRIARVEPPSRSFAPQPGQHGGTVVVDAEGLWVAERVPGVLVRCDLEGHPRSSLSLHPGLGELILDEPAKALYVADRAGDRVVRIDTAAAEPEVAAELAIREPHGLALTPDGTTLLVTSVADHSLVAVDRATMQVRWRVELASEPRGVAVAPDGATALVGFLSIGVVARVDLNDQRVRWHALDPRDQVAIELEPDPWESPYDTRDDDEMVEVMQIEEAASRFEVPNDIGGRFARNTFVLGFVGEGVAIVPHQLAIPQIRRMSSEGRHSYGGGGQMFSAIAGRRAWLPPPSRETIEAPRFDGDFGQVRALAWDAERDRLWLGDYSEDLLTVVRDASGPQPVWAHRIQIDEVLGQACGIDGVALLDEDRAWVHCELGRRLIRVELDAKPETWLRGPELAASPRSPEADLGAELFRRGGDFRLSDDGSLACATCHPEGRADGLSWQLGDAILQTPILAGRLRDTAPYKWNGRDGDLYFSFRQTISRLGGNPSEMRQTEYAALEAYLLSLPAPRPPGIRDAEAVARGRTVFDAECAVCHSGAATTDNVQHPLATSLPAVDTPSLIGVAHSAPYFHDGSAIDLAALIDDRGSVHDMVDTSALSPAQREDLVHYLESL
jgi:YVTN family beta-propeller protein